MCRGKLREQSSDLAGIRQLQASGRIALANQEANAYTDDG
jgi:hypothetical protein